MSSNSETKTLLKPFFDEFNKALESQQVDKAADYYHPDAVLVHKGKNCWYGREGIKQELLKYEELMGKATTKLFDEAYQMTSDYIIVTANYETTTEKMGTIKGKFSQIWKKAGNSYSIYHDEFEMN
ncbi:hypothetical protein V3C99_007188 [Haemonchus contortus]